MKANEFVKKFGWEEAEEIVGGLPEKFKFKPLVSVCWDNNTYKYSDRFKPRSSLKRLVESHELVEELGGLYEAKNYVPDGYKSERLKQAIADVESCQ